MYKKFCATYIDRRWRRSRRFCLAKDFGAQDQKTGGEAVIQVKICGVMNSEDIDICVHAGVHMLGFVTEYPTPVPWNLTAAKAGELIRSVPPFVSTCVVTGGSVERVLNIVHETCPDVVQLHYNETLREVAEIAHKLQLKGIKTIKALRINTKGECNFEITDPATAARELSRTGISAILADSCTDARPGGTGVMVDITTYRTIQKESALPVILAGGINPENILPIIHKVHPCAVDILTGSEAAHGCKDPEKIRKIMHSISVYNTNRL